MTWWGAYVGLPFGEGPRQETCWSLVARVYRERLAIELPPYGEISARDLLAVARAIEAGKRRVEVWRMVDDPRAFDVCLMRAGRGGAAVVHVGVMVDPARVLHVEEATAAVVVPVRHFSIAGRVTGYARHVAA